MHYRGDGAHRCRDPNGLRGRSPSISYRSDAEFRHSDRTRRCGWPAGRARRRRTRSAVCRRIYGQRHRHVGPQSAGFVGDRRHMAGGHRGRRARRWRQRRDRRPQDGDVPVPVEWAGHDGGQPDADSSATADAQPIASSGRQHREAIDLNVAVTVADSGALSGAGLRQGRRRRQAGSQEVRPGVRAHLHRLARRHAGSHGADLGLPGIAIGALRPGRAIRSSRVRHPSHR